MAFSLFLRKHHCRYCGKVSYAALYLFLLCGYGSKVLNEFCPFLASKLHRFFVKTARRKPAPFPNMILISQCEYVMNALSVRNRFFSLHLLDRSLQGVLQIQFKTCAGWSANLEGSFNRFEDVEIRIDSYFFGAVIKRTNFDFNILD